MSEELYAGKCSCGAVTVQLGRVSVSMTEKQFHQNFMDLEIEGEYGNCNYCVNHWGIDLCGCGSGEHFSECKEGFDECGTPMQSMADLQEEPEYYLVAHQLLM